MMPSEWHDWHDFYMLLGTASAALVALLFVAVSIGASFLTPERSVATRTFMSPVVFHFSTLLLISLIAIVPSHTALSLAIGITLVAVAGLAYTTVVLVGLARASVSDIADRFGYWILPARGLSRDACRGGARHFARRTRRRYFGGRVIASSRRQHSQCLGSDAGFCAAGCNKELGYLISASALVHRKTRARKFSQASRKKSR